MGKRADDFELPSEADEQAYLDMNRDFLERLYEGHRDPARIERMAAKLAAAWAKAPYLRLGQMVINLAGTMDPFMVEDDKMEAILDAFIKQGGYPKVKRRRGAKP